MSYADHDHRGDYADQRHDHDPDYAEKYHRHHDLEREDERLQAAIREWGTQLEELRRDLGNALARIVVLEAQHDGPVHLPYDPAWDQPDGGGDLPGDGTGADPGRPETWAFADAGERQAERAFTHPDVLTVGITEGWAEPETDPARIDWDARLAAAAIPFQVTEGRPVNPCASTGIRHGRNELGLWDENLMADALVTVTCAHYRYLLMVERADGRGWAVPGGAVEPGETGVQAAVRELAEETGLVVPPEACQADGPLYVPDLRASDEAWAVTVPVRVDLGRLEGLSFVTGGDDARRAEWVRARTYEDLVAILADVYGGQVFAAHTDMLRRFLGPDQATLAALITDAAAQECTYCHARRGVPCVTGPDGWHLARFLGVLPGRAEARLVGAATSPHGDMGGIVRDAQPEVTG